MATVTLTSGANTITVDTEVDECNTLDALISAFRDAAGIPENATIAVNGETDIPEDYELQDEDEVSVTKTSGSKGR